MSCRHLLKIHYRKFINYFRQLFGLRARDSAVEVCLPLLTQRLPSDSHFRGDVVGQLPHTDRCGASKNSTAGHSLSRHHQHVQQRHVRSIKNCRNGSRRRCFFLRARIPVASQVTALEIWLLACILLVFGALGEYAFILRQVIKIGRKVQHRQKVIASKNSQSQQLTEEMMDENHGPTYQMSSMPPDALDVFDPNAGLLSRAQQESLQAESTSVSTDPNWNKGNRIGIVNNTHLHVDEVK